MYVQLEIHVNNRGGWTTLQMKCKFDSFLFLSQPQSPSLEMVPFAAVPAETLAAWSWSQPRLFSVQTAPSALLSAWHTFVSRIDFTSMI